ncbi:hypothetical protein PV371_31615 [Streptomyces sp. TX20-6-3]|uniref:hypothetical protein n=1 Tax=Streptomyces sp. TX20-6-3 TaxID=3028705 RepID=UPI0029B16607|nr:hypothetical protein [Streptomyces sp. TX20-6-3]MDX2564172.1 hypothetical protein [Streptomyces sp. TX20-6-3]
MNRLTYWLLIALCAAVEIWGQVIGNRDVLWIGAIAGVGVIAVARLLHRADRYEEFAETGEER